MYVCGLQRNEITFAVSMGAFTSNLFVQRGRLKVNIYVRGIPWRSARTRSGSHTPGRLYKFETPTCVCVYSAV